MSKEKIEELAEDIFLYCRAGLLEDDAKKIAEFIIDKRGYRKQEWISVEERLPSMDELCLLSMENRITKYRWVVIGYFHTNYDEYVTHWMPLPEAPKMRKEDEGK